MVVFDIGNTDTVIGFFKEGILYKTFRIRSLKNENAVYFEYRILNYLFENDINKSDFKKVVVSSVVPQLTQVMVDFSLKFLDIVPILVVPSESKLLKININDPKELGSDLFINALFAYSHFKTDCIIVDFGTALTFTVLTLNGEIEGVVIFPGIKTAIKSLFTQTSLLSEISLQKPKKIIGKNSMTAIQSGIVNGYESLVKGILIQIKYEIGKPCKVIATGGLSSELAALKSEFDVIDRDLTLKGLYQYGKNS